MSQAVTNEDLVEVETVEEVDQAEVATDNVKHQAYSDWSMKQKINVPQEKKNQIVRWSNARTKITATPMDTNVSMDMTVLIACNPKKATRSMRQRRT